MSIPDTDFTDTRLQLRDQGYIVTPVSGKRPVIADWRNVAQTADAGTVLRWEQEFPWATNTGLVHTDGVLALDVDCSDLELVKTLHKHVITRYLPKAPLRIGKHPKCAYFFRGVGALADAKTSVPLRWDDHQIEVRGAGGQTVVRGLHPDTGKPYYWPRGPLPDKADLPELDEAALRDMLADLRSFINSETSGMAVWHQSRDLSVSTGSPPASSDAGTRSDPEFVKELLAELPNANLDWDTWFFDVLIPVKTALDGGGYDLFEHWSARADKHDPAGCQRWWDSLEPGGERGIATLVRTVKTHGNWNPKLDQMMSDRLAAARPKPQDEFQAIPNWDGSPASTVSGPAPQAPALPTLGPLQPVLGAAGSPLPAPPPPRPRLYGNHVLRGAMTLLGGRGGVSKTNLALTEAASMVSSRKLLWDRIWFQSQGDLKVLHLNRDEDSTELRRRLLGIAVQHQLTPDDLEGLFAIGKDQIPGGFRLVSGGTAPAVDWDSVDWLVELIEQTGASVLQMDPLISFVSGETNDHFACLAAALQAVMRRTDVAVYVLHHLRKGGVNDDADTGADDDADALRGGGSLVDLARTARIVRSMTKGQAAAIHLTDQELRRRLVSVNSAAKENYYLGAYDLTWYRLATVGLGNALAPWPEDEIGVPMEWALSSLGTLPWSDQNRILGAIRDGGPKGPWSTHKQSGERHVSKLAEQLGLEGDLVERQVDRWLRDGVLHKDARGRDDNRREVRHGLGVAREPVPDEFA